MRISAPAERSHTFWNPISSCFVSFVLLPLTLFILLLLLVTEASFVFLLLSALLSETSAIISSSYYRRRGGQFIPCATLVQAQLCRLTDMFHTGKCQQLRRCLWFGLSLLTVIFKRPECTKLKSISRVNYKSCCCIRTRANSEPEKWCLLFGCQSEKWLTLSKWDPGDIQKHLCWLASPFPFHHMCIYMNAPKTYRRVARSAAESQVELVAVLQLHNHSRFYFRGCSRLHNQQLCASWFTLSCELDVDRLCNTDA